MMSIKTIVIIPAFNEEKTIGRVVEELKPYVAEIIVVDDCSSDSTGAKARNAGAFVISHRENKGYNISINDGFQEAAKRGADIFVTFDADGQHQPEDLKKITDIIKEGKADLVAGQRPVLTHVAEKIFALYTRMFFGIKDPLCGLKAYHKKVYQAVGHFDTVQSIGTQLMIEAVKKGFRIVTVPITINERKDTSRFYIKRFKANVKILKALVKVMML